MLTKPTGLRLYKPGGVGKSPRNNLSQTPMMHTSIMESTPLHIEVTLNTKGTGAILHINCQSDGKVERWMEDGEEDTAQAKEGWLWKLGCLLKLHGNIEYMFNDPWAYKISGFPDNYKLFAVERKAGQDGSIRRDYYLCGGDHRYRSPQEYYPHLHWLLDNAGGVNKPCICQYCDSDRTQQQINQIYPLPPQKESPKGPSAPKKQKKTRKAKNPRGVTSKRGLVMNRNSITTGPLFTLGPRGQNCGTIGHRRSRPMQS